MSDFSQAGIPARATPIDLHQVTANAANALTIPAALKTLNYLQGLVVSGAGASSMGTATITITGLRGGTRVYTLGVPAIVSGSVNPLVLTFPRAIQALDVNTAISVTLSAFGSGNTAMSLDVIGYSVK